MLIGCADDSTLISVVPTPGVRVRVAESLNRDLGKVNEWCNVWGIKLNALRKLTKTMIDYRYAQCIPRHHINYWRNCA